MCKLLYQIFSREEMYLRTFFDGMEISVKLMHIHYEMLIIP